VGVFVRFARLVRDYVVNLGNLVLARKSARTAVLRQGSLAIAARGAGSGQAGCVFILGKRNGLYSSCPGKALLDLTEKTESTSVVLRAGRAL
jgi:hypothetical protein